MAIFQLTLRPLLLALGLSWITACGPSPEASDANSLLSSEPVELSFLSEKRNYTSIDLDLKLRVDWGILGGEIYAKQQIKMSRSGAISLRKFRVGENSALFADNAALLMVEPGDSFTAQCSYVASLEFQKSASANLFAFGLGARSESGRENDLAVLAQGPDFAVTEGMTLKNLEDFCEDRFQSEISEVVERDLRLAAESKLKLGDARDPRLHALQQALAGQDSEFEWLEQRWRLSAPIVKQAADRIQLSSELKQLGWFSRAAYHFSFQYRAQDILELEASQITPYSTADEYTEIQRFAAFLNRNLALWQLHKEHSSAPFIIDTELLRE